MEGTDDIVDLIPAPGTVTEEGTFLNVENLLKDTTAALLGGDSSMVPDEALVALKTMLDGLSADDLGAPLFATGSYTGTGESGSANKNSITFPFVPKMVYITRAKGIWYNSSDNTNPIKYETLVLYGMTEQVTCVDIGSTSYGYPCTFEWSDNVLSWYYGGSGIAANAQQYQLNTSGIEYKYIALG